MFCKFTNEDTEIQDALPDRAKVTPKLGSKDNSKSRVLLLLHTDLLLIK